MKVFRGTPVADRLSAPHWERSIYRGPCAVRAEDLATAMDLAAIRFDLRTAGLADTGATPVNPWEASEYVLWTEHPDDPGLPAGTALTRDEEERCRASTSLRGLVRYLLRRAGAIVRPGRNRT